MKSSILVPGSWFEISKQVAIEEHIRGKRKIISAEEGETAARLGRRIKWETLNCSEENGRNRRVIRVCISGHP